MSVMTSKEFVEKAIWISGLKTVYANGMFGWVINDYSLNRKSNITWYKKSANIAVVNAVKDKGYFGFDCVNLIKAIVWGFNANLNHKYGGCNYASNGLPDVGADQIFRYCSNVSTNMTDIEPGEILGMLGHVGIYIGDGKVVECTWGQYKKVAITNIDHQRWTKHAKLKVIDYNVTTTTPTSTKAKDIEIPSKIEQNIKSIQKFINTYYITVLNETNETKDNKKIDELVIDGSCGRLTRTAICMALQMELNKLGADLDIDGSFGKLSQSAYTKFVGNMGKGYKGKIAMLWQCLIVGKGIDPNGIDSSFGNGCVAATNLLLGSKQLVKDGKVNASDWAKCLV